MVSYGMSIVSILEEKCDQVTHQHHTEVNFFSIPTHTVSIYKLLHSIRLFHAPTRTTSSFIRPSMPSGICMEVHTEIV